MQDEEARADAGFKANLETMTARANDMCPEVSLLKDPQLLVQAHLQQEILDNPRHVDVPDFALECIGYHDSLQKHQMRPNDIQAVGEIIYRAKLTIGVHFLLKKLARVKVAEDAEAQRGIADKAMERIRDKGIVVPPALHKAMLAFTTKEEAAKGGKGKGKGKGK